MRRPLLLLLLLLAPPPAVQALAPPQVAQAAPAVAERLAPRARPVLEALLERGIPGASLALALPDGAELTLAVGVQERGTEQPLAPADRLLSGSIGKTYVSAAAHLLLHEGRLALDERIAARFGDDAPEWVERVPNAGRVTLRQLLSHRSGIPEYVYQPGFARDLADPERTWRPEDLLAYVHDLEPLFAPGEGWAYADTNYVLVGMVIERVSGRRFYELVRERLLAPHGLVDTIPTDGRRLPGVVQGHVVLGRSLGVPERTLEAGVFVFNPQFEWCGGGWACTPADLARWAGVLFDGRAFEGEYLPTMLTATPAPALGRGARYGLGVILREGAAGRSLGHDGFIPGYLGTMAWYPEQRIAGALLLNSDDARALGRPLSAVLDEIVTLAAEEARR